MPSQAEIAKAAGIDLDEGSTSHGFVHPSVVGMPYIGTTQLKNISNMLNKQADKMTKEQIDKIVLQEGGLV